MMRRNLTVMMLMSFVSTAYAEPAPKSPETRYEFGDDLVRGDLLQPEGAVLQARGRSQRSSLVDVRTTFVPELLKSVETL